MSPALLRFTLRLIARFAYHLHLRNSHVSVLVIGFLHAAVLCSVLRVFLHVMSGWVGHDTSRG